MISPGAHNLLVEAMAELSDARFWWQIALIGASLGVAWLIAYAIDKHFPRKKTPAIKSIALRRVLYPLLALILLLIGKTVVAPRQEP